MRAYKYTVVINPDPENFKVTVDLPDMGNFCLAEFGQIDKLFVGLGGKIEDEKKKPSITNRTITRTKNK